MEQIRYNRDLEIILFLLKERKSHIREVSKKLKENHMNIKRSLDKLLKENIVDFNKEGKNKSFFLKKSIESRAEVISAEIYLQVKTLDKYPLLRDIFEKIIKNEEVKVAILFGSYAKRISNNKSDIDIYLNSKNRKIKEEVEKINSKINVKIGDFNKEDILVKEIIKNHVIIKGVEEFYERTN